MPASKKDLAVRISAKLSECPDLQAVVLGGSTATGTAGAESDLDLGLYYDPDRPLDLGSLARLVTDIDDRGDDARVTDFGEWGGWVNGGAWLRVEGQKVDLLYRDLRAVSQAIGDCRAGRVGTHFQIGHPAGFSAAIYAGEIDVSVPLYDPHGRVSALKKLTRPYPAALREALVAGLWEARFSLELAATPAAHADVYYVVGCAFRAIGCMVQALFAINESYWINEKGAVARVETFHLRPERFGARIRQLLGSVGEDPESLRRTVAGLGSLLNEVEALGQTT